MANTPTRYEEAAYEYHIAGARLFRLIYTLTIINIILTAFLFAVACIMAISGVGIFSSILQAIWNSL